MKRYHIVCFWSLLFSLFLLLTYKPVSAQFNPNDWFDECPDDLCGSPPAGGVGGGGGGGGPIVVNYDLGPLFSLQEDFDADGVVDTRDTCPFTPNDQSENSDGGLIPSTARSNLFEAFLFGVLSSGWNTRMKLFWVSFINPPIKPQFGLPEVQAATPTTRKFMFLKSKS